MIPALRDRWRRPATALSTAALALALSCAGALVAHPATAADDPPVLPDTSVARTANPAPSASDAELRKRVVEAARTQATPETTPKKTPFNGKVKVVDKAWKGVKIFGHGDLTGDGKADLLVRNSSGVLYLFRGTQVEKTPFAARIQARTDWNFTSYVTSGDVTGDGIADVMARDSGGTLWLYPGTNKASADVFGARKSLGTGFNQYNLMF
ncbi:FG-GAP repeat domain-containing protein [Streptomyces sp. NPDC056656]|uniref:FG-GAP repeat domain-containing protein n=1 Tax=Streptomyces sp. NPDC056656 TaxID=3345895 RepID=UPI003674C232